MESEDSHPRDTFEQVLADLKRQFREKRKELQELRTRIMQLETAKKIMSNAASGHIHTVPTQRELALHQSELQYRGTTLREAAVNVLREQGATSPAKAMSAREVAALLDKRRGSTERGSFYTQVYVVLRRAATVPSRTSDLPEVSIEHTGKGRRFYLT